MSHVVGIDIGTSGIKVGAMDRQGNLDFVLKKPYSLLYPKAGWVEIDVKEVWEKTRTLLLEIIQKVHAVGSVDAISLSTFSNSSIFMTKDGEPMHAGIMYLDQRSIQETEWIKEEVGEEEIYQITRNRIEPGMYTITTLLWMKNNRPDIYESAYKWGNLSTYILKKLTGQFVMDWTQASFSGMFDVVHYKWSRVLCEKYGVDGTLLPEAVDPSSIVGDLVVGKELGLGNIPVAAGGADTACSTFALGIKPKEMFESVGTSNVLTVCTNNPDSIDKRFLNRCHIIKNQWLSHGAMSTPGASICWFYETFLKEEGSSSVVLEELPEKSPVGANGVFFLPYMQGERTPIWDPNARGVFVGMHLNTKKEDMLRAILEGSALGLRQIYEIIEERYGLSFNSFQSIGGGSKNKVWSQIKSNVLNKEIDIKEISETGVYGVCLIAGTAAGYYGSLEEAVQQLKNNTVRTVKPEPDTYELYNELYDLYCELYPSLQSFFEKAARNRISETSKKQKVKEEVKNGY